MQRDHVFLLNCQKIQGSKSGDGLGECKLLFHVPTLIIETVTKGHLPRGLGLINKSTMSFYAEVLLRPVWLCTGGPGIGKII